MTNAVAKRMPGRVGIVVGFVALAALPALGLSAFAAADTGTGETTGTGSPAPRPELTDAQQRCLSDHGVTLPQRPTEIAAGDRPVLPTAERRAPFREAAAACGLPVPAAGANGPGFAGPRALRRHLTDAQKQCLSDHGVTLPQRPTGTDAGERPAPPTAEQRAALQQAVAACDIALPEHGPRGAGSAQGAAV